MELSKNQKQVIDVPLGFNLLIEGYSGVGKTTILLKKYEQLSKDKSISKNDTIFIVSNYLKKQLLLNHYFSISSNYNSLNVYTINELIYKYLGKLELALFENTIDDKQKKELVRDMIDYYCIKHSDFEFTIDFVLDEINFIQENICLKDDADLNEVLKKELKQYLLEPRRSIKKGLLSFREKQAIWSIYEEYLNKVLNENIFDEQTFYQSFLRLIYHQYDSDELVMTFSNIFLDDIQDFSKIQLDIINYLYRKEEEHHSCYLTVDELKAKDRQKKYKKSLLYNDIQQSVTLDINYRNSKNVFNIIKSNLKNNELINPTLPYHSKANRYENKSVLTYYYNKKVDEKKEVFFDRLDLLINNMGYSFKDILVIFNDEDNFKEMFSQCEEINLPVVDIYDHVENTNNNSLTFIYKKDLTTCEFKVVIIYDADNKKLCTGPINRIININDNFEDSIYFYTALSTAKDFLIINSSVSAPSHLLLPSHIDFNEFVFDVSSKFEIKATLNIYRISDFISFIKTNLVKYYGYAEEDLNSHPLFDIMIKVNFDNIGIKILDNNIDNDVIQYILKNGEDLSYIVIFDSHHYLTFKNVNNEFVRVVDIPNK